MIWDPDCKGPCDCPGEEVELIAMAPVGPPAPPAIAMVCDDHQPVQHRDRKPKWCNTCGRAANGELIGKSKLL